jgi:GNAT superfamily N-acetyltransferase
MASYRFCRPDDIPLLVEAVNGCYCPHFGAESVEHHPWDLVRFKQEITEFDLWPGACALASHGRIPIAVVLAARREGVAHVLKIATHPDHTRQGHASHLLDSLRKKITILAPGTRIEAVIAQSNKASCKFFGSIGYHDEAWCRDYRLMTPPQGREGVDLVLPVTVGDLDAHDVLRDAGSCSWERTQETVRKSSRNLHGLAIPSVDGYMAYLLFRKYVSRCDIVALGSGQMEKRRGLLQILLRALAAQHSGDISISKIASQEIPYEELESLGFAQSESYTRYSVHATEDPS